jgi:hypothetical protein
VRFLFNLCIGLISCIDFVFEHTIADPLTEMRNASEPLTFRNEYDPWSMPDDYTVWKMAPDYVKPLLPPHWQTQKAVHPFFSYFCGLYLLCVGIQYII